jgi:ribose 1,5-bisphosphokinase
MSTGRLFAVVGPSGAGKDTLLEAARTVRPDLEIARRVITRPETAGGEAFEGVTDDEFDRRLGAGEFALHWHAHGMSYGIPAGVLSSLARGRDVAFNGSRSAIGIARRQFPDLVVILVTAPVEVLAARLEARGRESREAIAARLARLTDGGYEAEADHVVNNGGALDDAVARFLAILAPATAGKETVLDV